MKGDLQQKLGTPQRQINKALETQDQPNFQDGDLVN